MGWGGDGERERVWPCACADRACCPLVVLCEPHEEEEEEEEEEGWGGEWVVAPPRLVLPDCSAK